MPKNRFTAHTPSPSKFLTWLHFTDAQVEPGARDTEDFSLLLESKRGHFLCSVSGSQGLVFWLWFCYSMPFQKLTGTWQHFRSWSAPPAKPHQASSCLECSRSDAFLSNAQRTHCCNRRRQRNHKLSRITITVPRICQSI